MSYPIGRFCIAAVAFVTAYAPGVRALQLDWQAPAGCPAAEAVLRDVRRLAGANESNTLEARAVVTEIPNQRWQVAIDLAGSATGHRTLTADNCAQLARASALIIALAANPEAALDLPGDEPAQDSISPPADIPVSGSKVEPSLHEPLQASPPAPTTIDKPLREEPLTHEPKQRPHVPVELLARAGFEWGSLPTSTGWLGIGVRARDPAYPINAVLTTHVTQGTSATFTNGVGASFRVVAAQVRVCVEPVANRWYVAGCGGMQLALVRGKGYFQGDDLIGIGYVSAVTFTTYRWIPAPLLALNVGYEFLPRFAAELGADLVVPTTRWQFVVENLGPLFRADEMQYLLYLGLGIRLN